MHALSRNITGTFLGFKKAEKRPPKRSDITKIGDKMILVTYPIGWLYPRTLTVGNKPAAPRTLQRKSVENPTKVVKGILNLKAKLRYFNR
mmetsp:Transcript_53704/g.117576  ORF Transcript_53704/g.117576 Transcript_53704/m.117576 type:complete len:90 (+) Transcript_53704:209-478(+)